MNHGLALIAAVLESRDLSDAIQAGATEDLLDGDVQVYWDIIMTHYETFHEVPSVQHFQTLVPDYDHHPPPDSIPVLVHELKTVKLGTDINEVLQQAAQANAADPWEAKKLLSEEADRVNVQNQSGKSHYVAGADERRVLRTMTRLRAGKGLLGYPWPWDVLNDASTGLCKGNTFYLYGRQKSKKTFLVVAIALFYYAMGLRVLIFTRELSEEELLWRIYCFAGGFDWDRFKKGDITTEGQHLLLEIMREMKESKRLIISDDSNGIAGYKAKIEELKPQLVIHDYFKALADDAMGDNARSLNQESRFVARVIDQLVSYNNDRAKIVQILVGHANREGAKSKGKSSTEHAWSDHITRRVDGAFRIISDNANDRIALIANEGRAFRKFLSFTVSGRLDESLGEFVSEDTSWVDNLEKAQEEESKSKARTGVSPSGTGRMTAHSFQSKARR